MFKGHTTRLVAAFGIAALLGTAGLANAQSSSKFSKSGTTVTKQSGQWSKSKSQFSLTADQQRQVHMIIKEVQSDFQAFQNKHGQRLGELRRMETKAKQKGQSFHPSLSRELKSIELMEPSVNSLRNKIWAIMTPQQQQWMTSEISKVQASAKTTKPGTIRVKGLNRPATAKQLKSSQFSSGRKSKIASGASSTNN